jgi:exonuclease III
VVAYARTDGHSEADLDSNQQFYLQLYSMLQRVQRRDLVVLLGDFNAQVGEMLPSHQHIRGPHPVQPQAASDNGMRLLDLASAQRLVLANILFGHQQIHQYTHQLAPRQNQPSQERVIDYILRSSKFCSSIRDCRVFRDVEGSDHRLLVCTLQLRLSSARQQPAARHAGLTPQV